MNNNFESFNNIDSEEKETVDKKFEKIPKFKIVLAGPPRSGKSCFREGIKQAIKSIPNAPYPYVITACPDGEGAWFQETVNNNPELAAKLKKDYKNKFTPEFVNRIQESVKNCSTELSFIDIGGITSEENAIICKDATHIIIISGDESKFEEWREFFERVNPDIKILAEIDSNYNDTEDVIPKIDEDGVLRGSVHHLERGEKISDRETIKFLSQYIVNKFFKI